MVSQAEGEMVPDRNSDMLEGMKNTINGKYVCDLKNSNLLIYLRKLTEAKKATNVL